MNSNDLRKILGAANDTYATALADNFIDRFLIGIAREERMTYATAMGIPSPPRYEPRVLPYTVEHPPVIWSVWDSFAQVFVQDELYETEAAAASESARFNGAYARAMA